MLKDQNGLPLEGGLVQFSVTEGTLSDTLMLTNTEGKAEVEWTLGTSIGEQLLTITAMSKLDTSTVEGTSIIVSAAATAKPPVPTTISVVGGQNQTALAGENLDRPIVVQVLDQYEKPYPGAIVNFSLKDDGSLSEKVLTTDTNGKVNVSWNLGTEVGIQELSITSLKEDGESELEGAPLTVLAISLINFKIGDFYEGGIIFYINEVEKYALVVTLENQCNSCSWGCSQTTIPIPSGGEEIARGFANSVIIEAHCDEPGIAAKRCLNVVSEGYDDWFLPSIGTLEELMLQRSIINATIVQLGGSEIEDGEIYWSSTQINEVDVFAKLVGSTSSGRASKSLLYSVRAVRHFTF